MNCSISAVSFCSAAIERCLRLRKPLAKSCVSSSRSVLHSLAPESAARARENRFDDEIGEHRGRTFGVYRGPALRTDRFVLLDDLSKKILSRARELCSSSGLTWCEPPYAATTVIRPPLRERGFRRMTISMS